MHGEPGPCTRCYLIGIRKRMCRTTGGRGIRLNHATAIKEQTEWLTAELGKLSASDLDADQRVQGEAALRSQHRAAMRDLLSELRA